MGVDRYPSLYYFGFGNFHQTPSNPQTLYNSNSYPNIVKFDADIYPEALYDWIVMLTYISRANLGWRRLKKFFQHIFVSSESSTILDLQQRVNVLSSRVSIFSTELEKYKNRELYDLLPNLGDAFLELSMQGVNQV